MFRGKRDFAPTGWRILIKPEPVIKKSHGGLILATNEKLERAAGVIGTIVKIGPSAWKDYKGGEPWAKVGDRVIFSKYAGAAIEDGSEDGLVLLNDEDVQAIILSEEVDNESEE